jgi:hypothetical protein
MVPPLQGTKCTGDKNLFLSPTSIAPFFFLTYLYLDQISAIKMRDHKDKPVPSSPPFNWVAWPHPGEKYSRRAMLS